MTLSEVAKQYIGKTEKPNNSGFNDVTFEKKMRDVGFVTGHAWCAYFAELCVIEWAKAIKRPDIVKAATQIFSGSSTATYKNADLYAQANSNGCIRVGKKHTPNSIAIYRYGNGWQGHTVIVESTKSVPPRLIARNIEGNTNDVGGREGYIVAVKNRNNLAPFSAKGLNFVGYINFI
jgi:hypothetical protein